VRRPPAILHGGRLLLREALGGLAFGWLPGRATAGATSRPPR
jgi:hypothetical protein